VIPVVLAVLTVILVLGIFLGLKVDAREGPFGCFAVPYRPPSKKESTVTGGPCGSALEVGSCPG